MKLLYALIATLVMGIVPARAASGYDLSDMWWTPAESGWGVEFVQQRDMIFAALYVYRPDGTPAWYTASMPFQGLDRQTHQMTYSGQLYETRGTWFGSPSFGSDPPRRVGTMTLVAPTMTQATLTYSVDGVTVTKQIRRLTFRWDDYDGIYLGGQVLEATRCDNPANDVVRSASATFTFARVGAAMEVSVQEGGRTCRYSGPYTQEGRLGRIDATFQCNDGVVGSLTFEEMHVERFSVSGRHFGVDNRGCHLEGRFAAVLR